MWPHHTTFCEWKSKCYEWWGVFNAIPDRKWNEKNLLQQQFIHLSFFLLSFVFFLLFSTLQSIKRSLCCGKKAIIDWQQNVQAKGKKDERKRRVRRKTGKRNTNLNGKKSEKVWFKCSKKRTSSNCSCWIYCNMRSLWCNPHLTQRYYIPLSKKSTAAEEEKKLKKKNI